MLLNILVAEAKTNNKPTVMISDSKLDLIVTNFKLIEDQEKTDIRNRILFEGMKNQLNYLKINQMLEDKYSFFDI